MSLRFRALLLGLLGVLSGAAWAYQRPSPGRYLENRGSGRVWVLPEEGGAPVPLESGERFEGGVDGFTDLGLAAREPRALIFKVVDGLSVSYEKNRVRLEGGSWYERIGQRMEGGWKDAAWLRGQAYFRDFFEAAQKLERDGSGLGEAGAR